MHHRVGTVFILALPFCGQGEETRFGGKGGGGSSGRRCNHEQQKTDDVWHNCAHEIVLFVLPETLLLESVVEEVKLHKTSDEINFGFALLFLHHDGKALCPSCCGPLQ